MDWQGAPVAGVTAAGSGLLVAKGVLEGALGSHMMNNAINNMKNDASSNSSSSRPRSTKHTDNRHVSRKKYKNKSKYKKPSQRKKLEDRTMKTEGKVQPDGRVRYDKDFKRKVGTKGETSVRVIVDPKKKKIVTSFPQKKQ